MDGLIARFVRSRLKSAMNPLTVFVLLVGLFVTTFLGEALGAALTTGEVKGQAEPLGCAPPHQSVAAPLQPNQQNPRYFSPNGEGKPVYLTGAHTWNNLVDMDTEYPLKAFDFEQYLAFLKAHHHNLIRLWAWEVTAPKSERYARRWLTGPQPWRRVGPESDPSGLPKFDLTQFNPDYFSRLQHRVARAQSQGFFVIIMLFEGWAVQFAPGRASHPFYAAYNLNGLDVEGDPRTIHTLKNPAITRIQEAYVQRVVEAVGDCENVLFEIVNEASSQSTAWQAHMMQFIRRLEQARSVQHPVGMTWQMWGTNETLTHSTADWISPHWNTGNYFHHPQPAGGAQVVLNDSDHLVGSSGANREWVWKSFTRGLNVLFMDRYERPDSVTDRHFARAGEVRVAMGHTRLFAERIDLGQMIPRTDISSGQFALASRSEYLIYEPQAKQTMVDLRQTPERLSVEWFQPSTGRMVIGKTIEGGARQFFRSRSGMIVCSIYTLSPGRTTRSPAGFRRRHNSSIPSQPAI